MGLGLESLIFDFLFQMAEFLSRLVRRLSTNNRRVLKFLRNEKNIERIINVARMAPAQPGKNPAHLIKKSRPWDPGAIDFSRDRTTLRWLSRWHRALLSGILRMFFLGDWNVFWMLHWITENAPKDDERDYLGVQEREEGGHGQLFTIAVREILGIEGDQDQLTRRFRRRTLRSFNSTFKQLRDAVEQLRDCSASERWVLWVRAVVIYHMIAERMVAGRGALVIQYIVNCYMGLDLLPGLMTGFRLVCAEEARHIAFGEEVLRRRISEDRELARVVVITLIEMAEMASGINLPWWLPKFPELPERMGDWLRSLGITEEVISMVTARYPA